MTGVRTPWHDTQLMDLDPEKLIRILRDAAEGDANAYLTLAEEMEERDLHYRSVLSTRKLAVASLPATVKAKSDDARDVELADAVREVLVESHEFPDLVFELTDAIAKGYAIIEIDWDTSSKLWIPNSYEWRDQRHFRWDQTLRRIGLLTETDSAWGEPLAAYKYVFHTHKLKSGAAVRSGLARAACAAFMCKAFGIKDWMAFAEIFGLPIRLGRYGPTATEDDLKTLAVALANIGTDAAASIPKEMELEFKEAAKGTGGDKLFHVLASFFNQEVSKAVLGQTMTSDDGSSLSQARVHNDVRLDILDFDARQISAAINRDLVKPFVDLNFGEQERNAYPEIRIAYDEPEDLKALTEAAIPWVDRGMTVEISVLRDRFGFPEPEEGAEVVGPMTQAPANADGDEQTEPEEDKGEKVAENRALLAAIRKALHVSNHRDEIDQILDGVSDWKKITDPTLEPVLRAINSASDYEDLLEKLKDSDIDASAVVKHLGTVLFQARGLGDATDGV